MKRIFILATLIFTFYSTTFSQTLLLPKNESVIQTNNLFFKWDGKDILQKNKVFQLIIKEVKTNQQPTVAMRVNSIIYQMVILNNESVNVNFGKIDSNENKRYAWQVITYDTTFQKMKKELSRSNIRTFINERNPEYKKWLQVDEKKIQVDSPKKAIFPRTSDCINGNIELGNFLNWDGYYGSRSGSSTVNLGSLSNGIINGKHTIIPLSNGFDPHVGGSILPQVSEGNYSIRLGNDLGGSEVDLVKYTFVVTPQNSKFSFKYALVLEDPNHDPSEQPFFSYYIKKGNSIYFTGGNPYLSSTPNAIITGQQIISDLNNPFFKSIGNGIVYRNWTPTCVDLSWFIGQTVTIVFLVTDCSKGGHYGYAYIDALCENNDAIASFTMPNEICLNQNLFIDGTASLNETSYFWSIEESDINGGRPNPSSEVSDWIVAQQAGIINYTSLYNSKGKNFKCNTYYRIKLAVNNDCSGWNETVKILYVKCPNVNAGNDQCVSCTLNGNSIQLGQGNSTNPSFTYSWSPSIGLNNPNAPSPTHQEGSVPYPITYTVLITDSNGCTNSDQVSLFCKKPSVTIEAVRNCCGYTLYANAQNYDNIAWSNGQTGVTSISVSSGGTYTVTVSNPCGQATQSSTISNTNIFTGPFNPIAYNSKFYPPSGGGGLADKLYIKDVISGNGAANIPNSYNVTDYELRIFDRWGGQFKTISGSSCDGFNNWAINWDGTDGNGALVPQGEYNWQLRFKNCQYTCMECQCPLERRFVDRNCLECGGLPGPGCKWYNHCKKWDVPAGTTEDVPICVGSVTVVR
jgi:flagellar hook assembly protein FlgD